MTRLQLPSFLAARLAAACCAVALAACGSSHTTDSPDAQVAMSDAGVMTTDSGVGVPDATVVEPVPSSCTAEPLGFDGEPCFCRGPLTVVDGFAYRNAYFLEAFDVRGDAPLRVAALEQMYPGSEITAAGGYLFVGGWGLEIFDIADPAAPRSVANLDLVGTVTDLFVRGNDLVPERWLFAGVQNERDGSSELVVFDTSVISTPREVTRLPLDGTVVSLVPYGASAAVAVSMSRDSDPDTATIIDLSEPAAPAVVARIPLAGGGLLGRGAAIVDDRLFVTGREVLLRIVDLVERRTIGRLDADDEDAFGGYDVHVSEGLAFIASQDVRVVDVSRPAEPRELSPIPLESGIAHYLTRAGDRLFTSNGNQLQALQLDCD